MIKLNLREIEKLISEGTPPLDYGASKATYLAAIRYIAKIDIPCLRQVDPWRIDLTRELLEDIFIEHDSVSPPKFDYREEWPKPAVPACAHMSILRNPAGRSGSWAGGSTMFVRCYIARGALCRPNQKLGHSHSPIGTVIGKRSFYPTFLVVS